MHRGYSGHSRSWVVCHLSNDKEARMRPKPALTFLALSVVVGFAWTGSHNSAHSQDAKGQDKGQRRVSSLELGAPFDLEAQQQFEQQLTPAEQDRLVELQSRSALAGADC